MSSWVGWPVGRAQSQVAYFTPGMEQSGIIDCEQAERVEQQPSSLWPLPSFIKRNLLIFSFFFNKFIYSFIYFWPCWVFVAARGLSLVAASGGYSSLQCVGFSFWWLLLLRSTGSRRMGFSSCGMRAQ